MRTLLLILFQIINYFGYAKGAVATDGIKNTGAIAGGNNEKKALSLYDIELHDPQRYEELILQYRPNMQRLASHYHRKAKNYGSIGGDEVTFYEKAVSESNPKIAALNAFGVKATPGVDSPKTGVAANYPRPADNGSKIWCKLDASRISLNGSTPTGYNLRKEFTVSFRDLTTGKVYKCLITDIDDSLLASSIVWFELKCFDSTATLASLLSGGMVLAQGESAFSYETGIPDSLIDTFEYRKFSVQTVKESWSGTDYTAGQMFVVNDENGNEWGTMNSVRAKALIEMEKAQENMFWIGTDNTNSVKTTAAKHRTGNPTVMPTSTGLYNEIFTQGGSVGFDMIAGDITDEFDTVSDHIQYFGFTGMGNLLNVFTSSNGVGHFEDVATALSVDYDMTEKLVSKDSTTGQLMIDRSYRAWRQKGQTWLFHNLPVFDDPFGLKSVLDGTFLFYPEAVEQVSLTKGSSTIPMDNIYMFSRINKDLGKAHMEIESRLKGTNMEGDVAQEFAATDAVISSCFGYAFCGMQRCFVAYNDTAA